MLSHNIEAYAAVRFENCVAFDSIFTRFKCLFLYMNLFCNRTSDYILIPSKHFINERSKFFGTASNDCGAQNTCYYFLSRIAMAYKRYQCSNDFVCFLCRSVSNTLEICDLKKLAEIDSRTQIPSFQQSIPVNSVCRTHVYLQLLTPVFDLTNLTIKKTESETTKKKKTTESKM